jgi:hypothetical protein
LVKSLHPGPDTNAASNTFSRDADVAADVFVQGINNARKNGDEWLSVDDFATVLMAFVDDGQNGGGAVSRSYLRIATMDHPHEPSVRALVQKILEDYRKHRKHQSPPG